VAKAVFRQVELDIGAYRDFLLSEDYLYPTKTGGIYLASELGSFFKDAQKELEKLLSKVPQDGAKFDSPDEKILYEYTLVGHGKTGTNREGLLTGWSGDMLCHGWKEKGKDIKGGIEQAEGQIWKFYPLTSDLCLVSDLPRAIHHAILLCNYPRDSPVKDLLPKLDELAEKLSVDVMKKSVSKEQYRELMRLALENGFIPTPLLRAQYYGPLELGPEKIEEKDKKNWIEDFVARAVTQGVDEKKARREAEAFTRRKELLFAATDEEGTVLTENRTGLVERIRMFYDAVNKVSVGKNVLVVTSSGCLEASDTYFRYFAGKGKLTIENEPNKQRGRLLEVKLGRFDKKPSYLNDSKLLDPLRERAKKGIRQLQQLSIDNLVRDGNGIVETPLRRVTNDDSEEPTELMELHGFSGPSINGVLDCEKPVLIFGHGGQGKTILMTEFAKWVLDNPKLGMGGVYVPVMENCGDLNIRAKQVLLSGQSMYDYLRSSAEIKNLPTTLLKENKFVFLIDDYQKLNDDFAKEMEDSVQRLKKEGHKVILFSRLEKPGTLPPKVPGYSLFQINAPSRTDSLDDFISARLSGGERGVFRNYIQQYDASVTGNYLSLAFLTMLFGKAGNNVLSYIQDERIAQAIKNKQPLNQAQLYEALTDYVVGLDVERMNSNRLSADEVRKETTRLKYLLGVHAFNEARLRRIFESSRIDEDILDATVKFNSHLQKELRGVSLLYVRSDAGIEKNFKDPLGSMFKDACVKDGFPFFVHDTFREFFTARLLLQEIKSGKPNRLQTKLSKKTLEFIAEMNPKRDLLYKIIDSTRKIEKKEYSFSGGNCATLLAMLGEDLRGKDFSGASLRGADLSDQNLEGMILNGAYVKDAVFHYSNLNGVDFRGAQGLPISSSKKSDRFTVVGCDGEHGDVYMINGAGSLLKWNLREGKEVMRMKFGEVGPRTEYFLDLNTKRILIKQFGHNLKMYELVDGKRLFTKDFDDLEHFTRCAFSPDGTLIAVFAGTVLRILDAYSGDTVSEKKTDIERVNRIRISPNNRYVACNFFGSGSPEERGILRARLFELKNKEVIASSDLREAYPKHDPGLEWTVFSHDSKLFTAPGGIYCTESLYDVKPQLASKSKVRIVDPKFFTKNDKYVIFKPVRDVMKNCDEIYAHEIATGMQRKLFSIDNVYTGTNVLSGDGKLILYESSNGVNVYSLEGEKWPEMKFLERIDCDSFQRLIK